MTDSTYIRAYNGKSIYTSGQMKAGSRSDGDVSVAGVIQLDKINVAGAICPVNGALSRDDKGATLLASIRYVAIRATSLSCRRRLH